MPSATAREFQRVASQLGFVRRRPTGSHERWIHPDGRAMTIPILWRPRDRAAPLPKDPPATRPLSGGVRAPPLEERRRHNAARGGAAPARDAETHPRSPRAPGDPLTLGRDSTAIDYGERGLRVNVVAHGFTHSGMLEPYAASSPDLMNAVVQRHSAMNRLGDAEETAEAITWLCSDAARFVNGAVPPVDGGSTSKLY